jgi:hypothetical protein
MATILPIRKKGLLVKYVDNPFLGGGLESNN